MKNFNFVTDRQTDTNCDSPRSWRSQLEQIETIKIIIDFHHRKVFHDKSFCLCWCTTWPNYQASHKNRSYKLFLQTLLNKMTQAEKLDRVLENKKVCRISKSEFFSNPDSIDVLRCENLKGYPLQLYFLLFVTSSFKMCIIQNFTMSLRQATTVVRI